MDSPLFPVRDHPKPGGHCVCRITLYFEVEELYVVPERRSRALAQLFRCAEEAVKSDAEYMVLSTVAKNWKAAFHFYPDELEMTFWSALSDILRILVEGQKTVSDPLYCRTGIKRYIPG